MMGPWEDVERDPRFQGLDPAAKQRVRARWEASQGGEGTVPAPGAASMQPEMERPRAAARRAEPGIMERVWEGARPALAGAARLQELVEYPFKRGGEMVTEATKPYIGETLAGLAGGAVEYAPYAPLLGLAPEALAARGVAGVAQRTFGSALRFAALEAERRGAHGLATDEPTSAGDIAEAASGGFLGGAAGHLAIGEVLAPAAVRLARALRRGEASPHVTPPSTPSGRPDFVGAPDGTVSRDAAGNMPAASDAQLQAAAAAGDQAAIDALQYRRGGSAAAAGGGGEGEPRPGGRMTERAAAAANDAEILARVPAQPSDPTTAATSAEVNPVPPEAEAALMQADQAERMGDHNQAAALRQMADEIVEDFRRESPPVTDFVAEPAGQIRPSGPADAPTEESIYAARFQGGLPAVREPRGRTAPGMDDELPESREIMSQLTRAVARHDLVRSGTTPARDVLSAMDLARMQAEGTVPDQKLLEDLREPRPDFLGTPGGAVLPTGQETLPARVPPAYERSPGTTAPPPAFDEGMVRQGEPAPAGRSLVPSAAMAGAPGQAPTLPGARTMPRPQTEPTPGATLDALRRAMELRRLRERLRMQPEVTVGEPIRAPGGAPPLPTEPPPAIEPRGGLVTEAETTAPAPDNQPDGRQPEPPVPPLPPEPTPPPAVAAPPEQPVRATEPAPAPPVEPIRKPANIIAAEPEKPRRPSVVGRETRAVSPKHPDVAARFEAVELGDLETSHTLPDLELNPRYPEGLQPRPREKAASRDQIAYISGHLDPELLAESPLAAHGAPVIGPGNVVESGNGRVLSIRRALERDPNHGSYTRYQRWLIDNAGKFGLDPRQVAAMDEPVLVRRRTTPFSDEVRRSYAADANVDQVMRMSASEQAKVDARSLTPDVLSSLDVPENGDFLSRSNGDFVRKFTEKVLSTGDMGDFLTGDGKTVSQAGVERMRSAVLARVFDQPSTVSLLERLTVSPDDNIRNITGALVEAAPQLVRMKTLIGEGRRVPLDLTEKIATAAERFSAIRSAGESVSDHLRNADMFGRDASVDAVLGAFDEFGRSKKRLAEFFRNYADVLDEAGDPSAAKLAGIEAPKAPTAGTILDEAARRTREEYAGQAVLGLGKRAKGEKLGDQTVTALESQLRIAEADGNTTLAANVRAQIKLVKEGFDPKKFGGPGAASVSEFTEQTQRTARAIRTTVERALGRNVDPRIVEQRLEDVPEIMTYLATPDFIVRRSPPFRAFVRRLWDGLDAGDRLHHSLLERSKQDGKAGTGGWRVVQTDIPEAEKPTFERVSWESSMRGAPYTNEELRARGLGDGSIAAYHHEQRLMKDALRLVVNPLRRKMGLPEVNPRSDFYLPHMFFGSYDLYLDGVRVRTVEGASAASRSEAYRLATEVLRREQVPEDVNIEIRPRYHEFIGDLPNVADQRALTALAMRLEKSETVTKDQILQAYRDNVSPAGFPRHFEYRTDAPGFSEQLLGEDGVVDKYLRTLSRWAPMRLAIHDVAQAIPNAQVEKSPHLFQFLTRLQNRIQGKQGAAETMLDDLLRRVPIMGDLIDPVRPAMRAARTARGVTSQLKIGLGNLSSGIVNAFQFPVNAGPIFEGYAWKGAAKALFPDQQAARWIQRFEKLRLLEPLFVRGEMAGGKGAGGRLLDKLFLPMAMAERQNRKATLLSAMYALTDDPTGPVARRIRSLVGAGEGELTATTFTDAYARSLLEHGRVLPDIQQKTLMRFAAQANEIINFRYDVGSRPAWTTGPVGEVVGQFRTFPTMQLQYEKRLIDMAAAGDVKPLMLHAGAVLASAGILGMPFVYLIDNASRWLTGKSPMDELTEHLPGWATRGLPALAGVDISRRVGMGDVAPQELADVAGPTISTLSDFVTQLRDHDFDMMARRTALGPGALYSFFQNYRHGVEREPNTRQRMRFSPDPQDMMWRLVGFQPEHLSRVGDIVRSTKRQAVRFKARKAEFVDRAVAARAAGDHSRTFEIMREAREAGIPITFREVLAERGKKRQATLLRLQKQIPKAMRPAFEQRAGAELARERLLGRLRGGQ